MRLASSYGRKYCTSCLVMIHKSILLPEPRSLKIPAAIASRTSFLPSSNLIFCFCCEIKLENKNENHPLSIEKNLRLNLASNVFQIQPLLLTNQNPLLHRVIYRLNHAVQLNKDVDQIYQHRPKLKQHQHNLDIF